MAMKHEVMEGAPLAMEMLEVIHRELLHEYRLARCAAFTHAPIAFMAAPSCAALRRPGR
jgi:hypothetical protein